MRRSLVYFTLLKVALPLGLAWVANRADHHALAPAGHPVRRMPRKKVVREAKKMHETLSQNQVDKMVADTFPASDPPSTY